MTRISVFLAALSLFAPAAHAVMRGGASGDEAVVGVTQDGRLSCTGTWIDSRAILTAAHCLRDLSRMPALGARWGQRPLREEPVSGWRVAPNFDPDTLESDLALLIVDGAAPPAPPAILAEPSHLAVGTQVRLVGYGAPDRGSGGEQTSGFGRISAVGPDTLEIVPDPARACSGDSGGPVFVEEAGQRYLVGVISSGTFACDGATVLVRVAAFASFIDSVLGDARATDRAAGQPCLLDRGCRAGRCARGGANLAAAACAPSCAAGCPGGWHCPAGGEACLPDLPAGGVGTPCRQAADCQQLDCLEDGSGARACTRPCSDSGPLACPAGFRCALPAAASSTPRCLPALTAGCRYGAAGRGGAPSLIPVTLAGWLYRRRARRA